MKMDVRVAAPLRITLSRFSERKREGKHFCCTECNMKGLGRLE